MAGPRQANHPVRPRCIGGAPPSSFHRGNIQVSQPVFRIISSLSGSIKGREDTCPQSILKIMLEKSFAHSTSVRSVGIGGFRKRQVGRKKIRFYFTFLHCLVVEVLQLRTLDVYNPQAFAPSKACRRILLSAIKPLPRDALRPLSAGQNSQV